jgi:glycosyltransferase involved in cell wall biosynthesis
MKQVPRVSVNLTSFNHEKYIREAIDGVPNQSFTDFELNIRGGASSDGSWEIINGHSDPRIEVFCNDVSKRAAS